MKRFAAILTIFSALIFGPCSAKEIVVSKAEDSGTGSLREALKMAKKGDIIIFEASLAGSIIELNKPLPEIKKNISLLGPAEGLNICSRNFEPLAIKSKRSRIENLSFISADPLFIAEEAALIWTIEKGKMLASLTLNGEGDLIKNGEGTLSLDSQNEKFKGAIHVQEGVLEINGEGEFEVYIEKSGEMKGSGSAKKIVNEGLFKLGRRHIKVEADYIQNSTGTLQIELSPRRGCGFIQIEKRGLFEGTLHITCAEGDYLAGQTYHIGTAKEEIFSRMELMCKKGKKLVLKVLKNDIFIEIASPFSVSREL